MPMDVQFRPDITQGEVPVLYLFSGLPGVGKSTLAQKLAQHTRAYYLRIDTLEQGLRDVCHINVEGEGYRLGYRLIADNLKLGLSCIADCCNPIALTRREWQAVATEIGVPFINIEVCCSDVKAHRHRVQTRSVAVSNLRLPLGLRFARANMSHGMSR